MTGPFDLPRAAAPFVAFAPLLRANGFAVAPEQTLTFVEAVGLLGPGGMADIRRAALACLAPPPERRAEFDALFRAHFFGQTVAADAPGDGPDDEMWIGEEAAGTVEPPEPDEQNQAGEQATGSEVLSRRLFPPLGEAEALRRFRRAAPRRLPRRRSYRRTPAKAGDAWNMRRSLRHAVRTDGEVMSLPKMQRKWRQRRLLLLIDVSGSMKATSDAHLRFAHALAGAGERAEVFTIGTRLTRISRALRHRNRDQALARAAAVVADWDGGTRLGDALAAFLAVPRFATFARGAAVIVLSDGLERGDHGTMVDAVARLSRSAWRLVWLTPLAAGSGFEPQTEALAAVRPYLDTIGDAGSIERICTQVLELGRVAA